MNWIPLQSEEQLDVVHHRSHSSDQVIFKHSTRCSISIVAKNRLDHSSAPEGVDFYYLDLLQFRPLSNAIAEKYQVHHESPQVLLIRNGECIFDESHNAISMDELKEQIAQK